MNSVWIHFEGWAGHVKVMGELVKQNAKRSRVKLLEHAYGHDAGRVILVPNYAITERETFEQDDPEFDDYDCSPAGPV